MEPRVIVQSGNAGETLATAWLRNGEAITVGADNRLLFWDMSTGRVIDRIVAPLPPPPPESETGGEGNLDLAWGGIWRFRAVSLSVSPDRAFATVSVRSTSSDWEQLKPTTLLVDLIAHRVLPPIAARPLIWIGSDRWLADKGDGAGLTLIDARTGTSRPAGGRFSGANRFARTADGHLFAALVAGGRGNALLKVWQSASLAEVASFSVGDITIAEIGFDRAGTRVFARPDAPAQLMIFDLASRRGSTVALPEALLGPGGDAAAAKIVATDIDTHTVIAAYDRGVADDPDRSDTPGYAMGRHCLCQVWLADFETGAVLARVPGKIVARDRDQGAVVVNQRQWDPNPDGPTGPILGDAVLLSPVSRRAIPLGSMVEAPAAISPDGARFLARSPVKLPEGRLIAPSEFSPDDASAMFVAAVISPADRRMMGRVASDAALDSRLSPDGRRMALLFGSPFDDAHRRPTQAIKVWDAAGGQLRTVAEIPSGYNRADWISNDRLALHDETGEVRSLFLDLASGAQTPLPFGMAWPVGDGSRLVGWDRAADTNEAALAYIDPATLKVVARPAPMPPWTRISDRWSREGAVRTRFADEIAVSPDRGLFAAAFKAWPRHDPGSCGDCEIGRIGVFDARTGALVAELRDLAVDDPKGELWPNFRPTESIAFSRDGARVLSRGEDVVRVWDARTGVLIRRTPVAAAADLDTPRPGWTVTRPSQTGVAAGLAVRWRFAEDGSLRVSTLEADETLFIFYLTLGDHWLAVTPDGLYDTDMPGDTPDIRWLAPDEPDRSLPPQTFMRDNWRPGLVEKLLACSAAGNCAATLPRAASLAGLNRVFPVVAGLDVEQGPAVGQARVTVTVAEGLNPAAPNGKTRSGIHDIRLFRDGRLVGQWPQPPPPPPGAGAVALKQTWASETALDPTAPGGVVTHGFLVALPASDGGKPVTFTAYAFNSDRVKGETVAKVYQPAGVSARRPRRAFVVAIGVNTLSEIKDSDLTFAAADAHAVVGALGHVEPYDTVVPIPLVAEKGAPSHARKADIRAALDRLAGGQATPDDAVILTFSGHGWASPDGDFYLIPSDGREPDPADPASLASLISGAELTDWLRGIDAGEIAMVIDACHSAASVDAAGFKPGPMGDPGLGQLAFDKGVRILAAAQADAVAMENRALGQGLLTYALVHDGLPAGRSVTLDAWLRYGAERAPALSRALALGGPLPARGLGRVAGFKPVIEIQRPSLFDFTGGPSLAVLGLGGSIAAPPAAASGGPSR